MAFIDNLADMQATIYAELGLAAVWTSSQGAACTVTVLLASPAAKEDTGDRWNERPVHTPARRIRIRTSELTAQQLMAVDATTQSPAPVWRGATVNFDGMARPILTKPEPADDLYRVEWIFDLG